MVILELGIEMYLLPRIGEKVIRVLTPGNNRRTGVAPRRSLQFPMNFDYLFWINQGSCCDGTRPIGHYDFQEDAIIERSCCLLKPTSNVVPSYAILARLAAAVELFLDDISSPYTVV